MKKNLFVLGSILIANVANVSTAFIPLPSTGNLYSSPKLPKVTAFSTALQDQQDAISSPISTDSNKPPSKGFHCEHFGICPGCVVSDNVVNIDVIESAARFFASSSIQRNRCIESDDIRISSKGRNKKNAPSAAAENGQLFRIVIPSSTTEWRTQAKLAVAAKSSWGRDGCIFGLYERGTHSVMAIPNCAVHDPQINKAVYVLTEATASAQTVAYEELNSSGQLRYVQCQVERSTNKVCLTLVWNASQFKNCQPGLSRLVKELKRLGVDSDGSSLWHSIWLHLNPGTGNNIFARGADKWFRLDGPEHVREPIPTTLSSAENSREGLLYFTPGTFRQANMDGFDAIAKHVARSIPPKSAVCELYAGVGLLGLTALSYAHHADTHPGGHESERGLRWLRCSDENDANPSCFERAVRSMPAPVTGRSANRSYSSTNDKSGRGRNGDHRRGQNQRRRSRDPTIEELLSGKAGPEARNDGKGKATYMVASAAKALDEGQALGADVVIVDPPRKGLDDEVLSELCKPINLNQPVVDDIMFLADVPEHTVNLVNDATTLIYVSCGFEAFTRDSERLLSVNAGWKLESATGYILFPGSNHVETVAIFKRQGRQTRRR